MELKLNRNIDVLRYMVKLSSSRIEDGISVDEISLEEEVHGKQSPNKYLFLRLKRNGVTVACTFMTNARREELGDKNAEDSLAGQMIGMVVEHLLESKYSQAVNWMSHTNDGLS